MQLLAKNMVAHQKNTLRVTLYCLSFKIIVCIFILCGVHVALLSGPTVHSLCCDLHYKYRNNLFQKKLRSYIETLYKAGDRFQIICSGFFIHLVYIGVNTICTDRQDNN